MLSAFAYAGINPCYAVNNQKRFNVVGHGAATLNYAALLSGPSFYSVPTHQLLFEDFTFAFCFEMAGAVTIIGFLTGHMRSMCKCTPVA